MRHSHKVVSQYQPHKDYDGKDLQLLLTPLIRYKDMAVDRRRRTIWLIQELSTSCVLPSKETLRGYGSRALAFQAVKVRFNSLSSHIQPNVSYILEEVELSL